MRITIGIDPDAEKHGVAVYHGQDLTMLYNMTLIQIMKLLEEDIVRMADSIVFAIENVAANNFIYGRNECRSPKKMAEKGRCLGRVQQAQIELMRMLDELGVEYKLYKPQRGNWANNENQFKQVTGWHGRSNQDVRAAAFFGYLALK